MQKENKTIVIIAGPSAVGKTSVGIEVAQHFGTSIISADSRQCFKELSIGVARPSVKELSTVPHYFIASHSIQQKLTVATFEEYALQKAGEIFEQNDVAVLVGGTGLYIKAFCEGLNSIPGIPFEIRDSIIASYKDNGLEWLQHQIKISDPLFFENGEIQNPQRLMRALEVVNATGHSILTFHQAGVEVRPFNVIKIGIELERDVLYERINNRVDIMMQQGLLHEAQDLIPYQKLNALQTVGYKQLFDYFDHKLSLPLAIEKIKTATRNYAKRQLTWFKKDKEYVWCQPDAKEIIALSERMLGFN